VALAVSGTFGSLARIITFIQLYQHSRHTTHAPTQKYIRRILWLVPVHTACSWFALWMEAYALYSELLRTCYVVPLLLHTLLCLLSVGCNDFLSDGCGEWMDVWGVVSLQQTNQMCALYSFVLLLTKYVGGSVGVAHVFAGYKKPLSLWPLYPSLLSLFVPLSSL
jgi:hypothetical protein